MSARSRLLTLRIPTITWIIKHMYTRCMIFGDSLFAFSVENSQLSYQVSPDHNQFCVLKKPLADRELIAATRLADDKCAFDTFSVAPDLVEDASLFFSVLGDAAGGEMEKSICSLSRAGDFYAWDFPAWFDYARPSTVGSWICATIERLLWLQYAFRLTEQQNIRIAMSPLLECPKLAAFWEHLSAAEKRGILMELVQGPEETVGCDRTAAWRLRDTAESCNALKLIGWLLFMPLIDLEMHDAKSLLLQTIRKRMSSKAARELMDAEKEKDKDKAKVRKSSSDTETAVSVETTQKTKKRRKKHKKGAGRKTDSGSESPRKASNSTKSDETDSSNGGTKTISTTAGSSDKGTTVSAPAEIDEHEEVAMRIASNIVVGVLSRIEEEEDDEEPSQSLAIAKADQKTEPPHPPAEERKTRHDGAINASGEKPRPAPRRRRKAKPNPRPEELTETVQSCGELSSSPSRSQVAKPTSGTEDEKGSENVEDSKDAAEAEKSKDSTLGAEVQLIDATMVEKNSYLNSYIATKSGKAQREQYDRLSAEIAVRCRAISDFNVRLDSPRQKLAEALQSRIKDAFPGANVATQIYGSTISGLTIESSDIDIGVMGLILASRQDIEAALLRLATALKSATFVESAEPIVTARVPVLKLICDLDMDSRTEQKVDITFNDERSRQVERGVEAAEFCRGLMRRFKYLREVSLVLKDTLARYGLNVPFEGISTVSPPDRRNQLVRAAPALCGLLHYLSVLQILGRMSDGNTGLLRAILQ